MPSLLDRGQSVRSVIDVLALALPISGVLWLTILWPSLPERVLVRLAPLATGPKLTLWVLPAAALLLYGLCSWTERAGLLNLPDLGSAERNRTTARRASAVLRLVGVSIPTLLMVGVVTASTSVRALAGFALILALTTSLLGWVANKGGLRKL